MASDKISAAQVLLPVSVLSLVLALSLGFQTSLLVKDHSALQQARTQQDKPLEQIEKIKTQASALASGTLVLAKQGNKDAQTIIEQLKKAGVNVNDQAAPVPGGTEVPVTK